MQDEHVEELNLNEEHLVVIQVYFSNAFRAYDLADHYRKGPYMSGGLHVITCAYRSYYSGQNTVAARSQT